MPRSTSDQSTLSALSLACLECTRKKMIKNASGGWDRPLVLCQPDRADNASALSLGVKCITSHVCDTFPAQNEKRRWLEMALAIGDSPLVHAQAELQSDEGSQRL